MQGIGPYPCHFSETSSFDEEDRIKPHIIEGAIPRNHAEHIIRKKVLGEEPQRK